MSRAPFRSPSPAGRCDRTSHSTPRPLSSRRLSSRASGGGGRRARWAPRLSSSTQDRKSTRLNSSHSQISHAGLCLKKKRRASTDRSHLHRSPPIAGFALLAVGCLAAGFFPAFLGYLLFPSRLARPIPLIRSFLSHS